MYTDTLFPEGWRRLEPGEVRAAGDMFAAVIHYNQAVYVYTDVRLPIVSGVSWEAVRGSIGGTQGELGLAGPVIRKIIR